MPSFWDYFVPIAQSSIEAGKVAANEGDADLAHTLLDNAKVTLDQAKSQTEQQIAERDRGTYDPNRYDEHGTESSKYHPVYGNETDDVTYDRRSHRENIEEMDL